MSPGYNLIIYTVDWALETNCLFSTAFFNGRLILAIVRDKVVAAACGQQHSSRGRPTAVDVEMYLQFSRAT